MSLIHTIQNNNLKEQRLKFIHDHQNAFDVDSTFLLSMFEKTVIEIDEPCGIEPSCKVEGDQLFAGRFAVRGEIRGNWRKIVAQALGFLDKIESRVDFKINRELLQKFLAVHIGSNKIVANTVGVDLRPSIEQSSVKIHIHIDQDQDAEELARTAINLDGGHYSPELTQVLLRDTTLIGFDFFLNGHNEVELYPSCPGGKYELSGNWGRTLCAYVQKNFSKEVISLFNVSDIFMAGFSKANIEPVLYFAFFNIKDIPKYFLFNSLGDRIYNFCQSQDDDISGYYCIGVNERDLIGNRLENFRFYYNKRI
jgi:LynF/TruF/PatF family peptide O-prenyltransferase